MTHVQAEIASQPDCRAKAAEPVVRAFGEISRLDPDRPRNLTRSVVLG